MTHAMRSHLNHKHPHLKDVLRLPLLERLTHRVSRRHIAAWLLGIALMLIGSMIASFAHVQNLVPPTVVDAAGYFLHGAGAIPIIKHIDAMWLLLVGEAA